MVLVSSKAPSCQVVLALNKHIIIHQFNMPEFTVLDFLTKEATTFVDKKGVTLDLCAEDPKEHGVSSLFTAGMP
jgi:hypothetical protein